MSDAEFDVVECLAIKKKIFEILSSDDDSDVMIVDGPVGVAAAKYKPESCESSNAVNVGMGHQRVPFGSNRDENQDTKRRMPVADSAVSYGPSHDSKLAAVRPTATSPVASFSETVSGRAELATSSAAAKSSLSARKKRPPLHRYRQNADAVIDLCDDDDDDDDSSPPTRASRGRGPAGISIRIAGEKNETVIFLSNSDDASDDSDEGDKKLPARKSMGPEGEKRAFLSLDIDSSDDELTMLHERNLKKATPPRCTDRTKIRERRRQVAQVRTAISAKSSSTPWGSSSQNTTQPGKTSLSPKPPNPFVAAPLRRVPVMGRSARAMKAATKPVPSQKRPPARKSPDDIMDVASQPSLKSTGTTTKSPPPEPRDLLQDSGSRRKQTLFTLQAGNTNLLKQLSDPHIGKSVSIQPLASGRLENKPAEQEAGANRLDDRDIPPETVGIPTATLTSSTKQHLDDTESTHVSEAFIDSIHDDGMQHDTDEDDGLNGLGDKGGHTNEPPLNDQFDDDTIKSLRYTMSRRHKGAQQQVKLVRHPMEPAATDARLLACEEHEGIFSDYESSEEEDSLPPGRLHEEQDVYECAALNFVDHVSQLTLEPDSKLPVWRFTVHGENDGTLFDFEVRCKLSCIPGAGNGAFLTFLGTRKLIAAKRKKGEAIIEELVPYYSETTQALQGKTPGGHGFTLSLTGENLHGNMNRVFWPPAMIEAHESGRDIDSPALRVDLSPPEDGIGFLGIYVARDYKPSPSSEFSSPGTCIRLGRYGPFRREDRKTDSLFTIKSYIFGNEPNEWPFDVEEELSGELQIIDITDDATGIPHDLAQMNIAMHVNEVGHNPDLVQNVFICHNNERSVEYFLRLESPMKSGETVELLTNYGIAYEAIRERKGYGRRNLYRGLHSDEDSSVELKRNFAEREDAENTIMMLECSDIVAMLDFIYENVWEPIQIMAKAHWNAPASSEAPSTLQWVALRRIYWLRGAFTRRILNLEEETDDDPNVYPYKASLVYCRELLSKMEDDRTSIRVSSDSLQAVGMAIQAEVREEIFFLMREKLPAPLGDPAVWCPMGARLLKSLSDCATHLLLKESAGILSNEGKATLLGYLLHSAKTAAEELRASLKRGDEVPDSLAFDSGVGKDSVLSRPLGKLLSTVKGSAAFYLQNNTTPKAYLAGVAQKFAYFDCMALANLEPQLGDFAIPLEYSKKFVMAPYGGIREEDARRELAAVPTSIPSTTDGPIRVNETWYLIWQIVYPAYAIASEFLKDADYMLKKLCEVVGVDPRLAHFAVTRGMKGELDEALRERYSRASPARKANRRKTRTSRSDGIATKKRKASTNRKQDASSKQMPRFKARPNGRPPAKMIREGKPDEELESGYRWPEGWIKKVFQRQSGDSKGGTDRYWYPPGLPRGKKLRSMKEVYRFLNALEGANGDVLRAWNLFKK